MSEYQLNRAVNNTFKLFLYNIPVNIQEYKSLELHLTDLVIPSLTINPEKVDFGPFFQQMTFESIEYGDFNLTFNVDEKFKNWRIFFNWLNFINNNKDSFHKDKKDFSVNATLQVLDNFLQPVIEFNYDALWITSLDEITLSFKDGVQELTSGCSFVFDRYDFKLK